jgi:hypothetical protein
MPFGLPLHEIIIPIVAWSLIIAHYIYMIYKGSFRQSNENESAGLHPYSFFTSVRDGWVSQNHLTGQAAANTTR